MHSFKITDPDTGKLYTVHHNSDWSGKAYICLEGESQIVIPGAVLRACARRQAINDIVALLEELE